MPDVASESCSEAGKPAEPSLLESPGQQGVNYQHFDQKLSREEEVAHGVS